MVLHPATEKLAPEEEDPRSRERGVAGGGAARGVSGAVGVWLAGVRTTVSESIGAGLAAEEGGAAGEAEGMKHLVSTLLNLAVRSVTRLRRMVDGTLGVDHEVSSVLAKRGPDERPASRSSYSRSTSASSTRSLCQPPLGAVTDPPVQHEQAHHEKRPKSHWHTSRLPAMLAPALPACSGHAVMPPPRCRCMAAAMSASGPAYPLSRA